MKLERATAGVRLGTALIGATMLVASGNPAAAAWKVTSRIDRITDKAEKAASVASKVSDHGVSATLHVYCLGLRNDTHPIVYLETSARFSPGRMGLQYRLDNDEPEPRFMPVDGGGRGMSLWAEPKTFFGKKRLRVELQPARSKNLFFEFDIVGAEQVIRGLGCQKLSGMD